MKPLVWIISVSITANALMAGLWIKQRAARGETIATESKPNSDSAGRAATALNERKNHSTSSTTLSGNPNETTTLTWQDIQSEELKELVRRLREVRCPEETIQDIIVAEVNRRYAARNRELWPDRFENKPFWQVQKNDPAEIKRNREISRKSRDFQKEKSALLVELLGVDPEKQRRKEEGLDEPMNWMDQRLAFLPEEKWDAALQYMEDFEDKMQDFYARTRGLWDAESRAEQRQLEAEKIAGLAQFLTPAELREYELRQSQTAQQMGWDLRGLAINLDEYEAIFDARKKYGDSIYNYGDIETKEAREQVEANKKAMQAEIVAALGATKGKEYERSQDYSYQELTRLSKKYELPAGTAAKVYDFKEAAEQGVRELQNDQNITSEQRKQALQQIRSETEKTIKDSMGETAFKRYQRQGGWWINNLAPSPPPKP